MSPGRLRRLPVGVGRDKRQGQPAPGPAPIEAFLLERIERLLEKAPDEDLDVSPVLLVVEATAVATEMTGRRAVS